MNQKNTPFCDILVRMSQKTAHYNQNSQIATQKTPLVYFFPYFIFFYYHIYLAINPKRVLQINPNKEF